MPKYIDSEALKRDLIDNRNFYPAIVANAIEHAPACDVVKVTRCKDCRYSREKDEKEKRQYFEHTVMCDNPDVVYNESPMWEDDFCSSGERKDEEK